PRAAVARPLALCVIGHLLFGVLFDAQQLTLAGWLGALVLGARHLLRFAFAALAVFVAIVALRREVRADVWAPLAMARLRYGVLLAHVATLVPLFLLSKRVFVTTSGAVTGVTPPLVLAWLLCACATAGTLVGSLLSWSEWRSTLRRVRLPLLASVGAGLLAVGLGLLADRLWSTLGGVTLRAVLVLLDRLEPEVLVSEVESVIGTPHFVVEISPECSGFEGMGLAVVFVGVLLIGAWNTMRIGRVLAFVPLLLVGVWGLNAVRIAALVW